MNQLRRPGCRPRVAAAATLWVALVLAGPARAQFDPAEAHYKTGQAYYQRGAYGDAIHEFERAYKLSKRPELLYNIGQTYERLGDLARAVEYFERYLKDSGSKNEALSQKVENLRRRLSQTGIRIATKVVGAVVSIDGRNVGSTPLKLAVPVQPGQHKVRVAKEGYTTYALAVSVTAGAVVSIEADLEPVGGGAAVAGTPPGGRTQASQPAGSNGGGAPPPPGGRRRLWTWITLGTAAALLAGGGVTGGLALGKASDAATPDDADADAAKTLGGVADVLLIAGAATAIAGVVLFFVEGRGAERSTARRGPTLVPALGPGYAGLGATVDF